MPALTEQDATCLGDAALLRTISYTDLQNEAPQALEDLFLAATEDGILYLNFNDNGGRTSVDSSVHGVECLSRAIFDMPTEKKLLFDVDLMGKLKLNGYKPLGRNKGGIKGQLDGFESYAISRDTMTKSPNGIVRHPSAVAEHGEAIIELTSACMDVTKLIFKALSRAFELPAEGSFESLHDSVASPLDLLRLLKYPNAIGDGAFSIPQLPHADMGSLTFLFTAAPGLQILPVGTEQWLNVLPMPGHAIVNFGDAMKIFSAGTIESVMHRVVTVPGKQVQDRYSFAFLVRPEASTPMNALTRFQNGTDEEAGSSMTCEEWVSMRFSQLRAKKATPVN